MARNDPIFKQILIKYIIFLFRKFLSKPNKNDSLEILEKELNNLPQRCQLHESTIIKDKINIIQWCKGYLHFLDPPGPLTALASYPGSGNTWLRYLIQQATGIATGSVYNAAILKVRKFQKEIVVFLILQKINKMSLIPALPSKEWLNHKIKAFSYIKYPLTDLG